MTVGDDNDVMMVGDCRPDGRVNAEIRRPSGNEQPIRCDLFQSCLQISLRERIVQAFADDNVGRIAEQFGKKLPAGCLRLKIVSVAMLDEDYFAGITTDLGGEAVDALCNAAQVVFGVALEQPHLHVDDEHCVHGRPLAVEQLHRRLVHARIARGDDAAAALGGLALPRSYDAAGAGDDWNQCRDVVGL